MSSKTAGDLVASCELDTQPQLDQQQGVRSLQMQTCGAEGVPGDTSAGNFGILNVMVDASLRGNGKIAQE